MNVRGWGDRRTSPFATPVFQGSLCSIGRQDDPFIGDDHRQVLGLNGALSEHCLGGLQRPSAEVRDFASFPGVEPLAKLDRELDRPFANVALLEPLARVGAHHERWLARPSRSFARGHKSDIAAFFRPSCCEHVLPCRDASGAQRKSGYTPTPYGHRSPDLRAGCEGRRPHPSSRVIRSGRVFDPGSAFQDIHRIPDRPTFSLALQVRETN